MSTKLELTWPGKDEPFMLEPRILIEDKNLSNIKNDIHTENILIHGDNLLALKALERKFAGLVKCVYIDPPYNTGAAFEHYDDNFEHSTWLNLMKPRLELLKTLLADDGSIWVTLDDNEVFYCKVLMDEIYGRQNFVGSIVWEKSDSPKMDPKFFSTRHDLILVYAKNIAHLVINREKTDEIPEHYNKIDENGRRYYLKPMRVMGGNVSPSLYYPMTAPDGTKVWPISSRGQKTCWRWSKKKTEEENHRIEWIKTRNGWSLYFRIYADTSIGIPIQTIWSHEQAGSNRTSKAEIKSLFGDDIFPTPKPEKLIQKVLNASTKPGDLVLDSFLGSGTTAAVALKMNRKFIGIEIGEHAYTHCKKRLDKVIAGEDLGGVTKSTGWTGGGGYRFFELAPSLLNHDEFDEPVINENYTEEMLARAAALHEGYTYEPDEKLFWKQSKGSEKSFLYVTSQHVSSKFLASIHNTMGENEFLIIACRTYDKGADRAYKNIKIKKIPQVILDNCEYDRENYNLNIINPPVSEDFEEEEEF